MGKPQDSISIIVPALNEEAHLAGSVNAMIVAARRHFASHEILVFDDGSRDRTGQIADELAARHDSVVAIHHSEPRCVGGVLKEGLRRAGKRYWIWVDAKGATTTEALEQIFVCRHRADVVVPYTRNCSERSATRRFISRAFVKSVNGLFGLRLRQYTHLVLAETAVLRSVAVHTNSYAFPAELLIKLIRSGRSYVEVGVVDCFGMKGTRTKAFHIKNLTGVVAFMARTLWDVNVQGRSSFNSATVADECPGEIAAGSARITSDSRKQQ